MTNAEPLDLIMAGAPLAWAKLSSDSVKTLYLARAIIEQERVAVRLHALLSESVTYRALRTVPAMTAIEAQARERLGLPPITYVPDEPTLGEALVAALPSEAEVADLRAYIDDGLARMLALRARPDDAA